MTIWTGLLESICQVAIKILFLLQVAEYNWEVLSHHFSRALETVKGLATQELLANGQSDHYYYSGEDL